MSASLRRFLSNATYSLIGVKFIASLALAGCGTPAASSVPVDLPPSLPDLRQNLRPVANAGPDITEDATAHPVTTLDASASFDPDGSIVAYYWSVEGAVIANQKIVNVLLPPGVWHISLRVVDNAGGFGPAGGAAATDEILVTRTGPKLGQWHGDVDGSDFTVSLDSEGFYIGSIPWSCIEHYYSFDFPYSGGCGTRIVAEQGSCEDHTSGYLTGGVNISFSGPGPVMEAALLKISTNSRGSSCYSYNVIARPQ